MLTIAPPLLLLAAAAYCDLRWRIIPNTLCAVLALGGLAVAASASVEGAAWTAGAAGIVFLGGAALFALGAFGGGDVKLAAATATWIAPEQVFAFVVLTSLLGAIVGLVGAVAGVARHLRRGRDVGAALAASLKSGVPYGVAIAAAGSVTMWMGQSS